MFTLSKASEYAILFLANLAKKDRNKPVNLKDITYSAGLPYKFLSRIVLDLKKAKIIKSKEGVGGGYFLAKKPENISLFEIIKTTEGEKGLVSCIHGKCFMGKTCLHKKVWEKLQFEMEEVFKKISFKDLV